MKEIFNFSAGPAMLPKQIMQQIKNELYDWNNLKISVMEISHRSNEFIQLANDIDKDIRFLLKIPKNYKVLFCQGGARAQFSAIPMNLLNSSKDIVDYINTGYWSYYAAMEAKKYCSPRLINVCEKNNGIYSIKPMDQWNVSLNSTYIHYCPNETINGISIDEQPIFSKNKILIADCSSTLFSKPLDVSRFGIVYAAAQKNIGLSGLTLVIIREDLLLKKSKKEIPSILNYQVLSKYNSMFNTPVTFSWYVAGLMFKWLRTQGGLEKIDLQNQKKSSFLYKEIDCNSYYYNNVDVMNRSKMNIPFFLKNKNLEVCFLNESRRFGLYGLQGHKAIGGIRASLYNSMPLVGVKKLVEFMRNFSKKKS